MKLVNVIACPQNNANMGRALAVHGHNLYVSADNAMSTAPEGYRNAGLVYVVNLNTMTIVDQRLNPNPTGKVGGSNTGFFQYPDKLGYRLAAWAEGVVASAPYWDGDSEEQEFDTGLLKWVEPDEPFNMVHLGRDAEQGFSLAGRGAYLVAGCPGQNAAVVYTLGQGMPQVLRPGQRESRFGIHVELGDNTLDVYARHSVTRFHKQRAFWKRGERIPTSTFTHPPSVADGGWGVVEFEPTHKVLRYMDPGDEDQVIPFTTEMGSLAIVWIDEDRFAVGDPTAMGGRGSVFIYSIGE